MRLIESSDRQLRMLAVSALGGCVRGEVFAPLVELVQRPNDLRLQAIYALINSAGPLALDVLVQLVRATRTPARASPAERCALAYALLRCRRAMAAFYALPRLSCNWDRGPVAHAIRLRGTRQHRSHSQRCHKCCCRTRSNVLCIRQLSWAPSSPRRYPPRLFAPSFPSAHAPHVWRVPSPGLSIGAASPAELTAQPPRAGEPLSRLPRAECSGASGTRSAAEGVALYATVKRTAQREWWREVATLAHCSAERIGLGCDAIALSRVVFRIVSS
jgi:hypothetical protein